MFVFVQPTTNYLYVTCCYIEYNKMKNKLFHTVGTVPKSNRKTNYSIQSERFQNLIEKHTIPHCRKGSKI